jgi:hypothetical protein
MSYGLANFSCGPDTFGGSGQQLQQFQVGTEIGYGFYRSGSIFSSEGRTQAGVRNRFATGIP